MTIIDSIQITADHVAKKYINGIYNTLYVDEYKDNMIYEKLDKVIDNTMKRQLWKILLEVDYEFTPPLSYRDSTTFTFDNETKSTSIPEEYYKNLLQQNILISSRREDKSVIGFISYIPDYKIIYKSTEIHCFYITTIGVTKGARGNGIARQFYIKIEEEVRKSDICSVVATRTWSTNKSNIRILESMEYQKGIEIKDDRGSGIHTVYYSKQINKI